ncbi:MAG: TonB-dependent receptor plug domain-containing protein, partial [Cyclobacteriaceae bacterium]|nr:TonB-dependent receptor plug domain-containing protein [Cyclobacteriaceae bacterium]
MRLIFLVFLIGTCFHAPGQSADTLRSRQLDTVTVKSNRFPSEMSRLPAVQSAFLFAGKKSEVINVGNLNAAIALKTPRQIFAKVPGVFVYDMDGTGNQMNISLRGLDPHRGWELNTRQNGIITNSDMYGYPASHYSMPMEAVERIELVRGTASLQYGAQFGGMVNYVSKSADTTRAIGYEGIQTVGSFGTLSSFHAVGGKVGKFTYYGYANKRVSDGYRKNSSTHYDAEGLALTYSPLRTLRFTAEFARSNYVYQ